MKLLKHFIPLLCLAAFSYVFLLLWGEDLLYVMQLQDLFTYDAEHWRLIARTPGFLPAYLGSFLTQFAFHPHVAVILMSALLTLLAGVVSWAFRRAGSIASTSIVPSLCLLAYLGSLSYGIWSMRHYGNAFSPVVGLLVGTVLVGIYVRLRHWIARLVWMVVVAVVGYPFFGIYALLAMACALITDWLVERRGHWAVTAVALVMLVFAPAIVVQWLFVAYNTRFNYLAGLPYCDFEHETLTWATLWLALASTVLSAVYRKPIVKDERWAMALAGVAVAGIAYITVAERNQDSNFRTLLAVERAYGEGDRDRALQLCAAKQRPLRSMVLYRNAELYRRGELLDKMFQYTWVTDTIQSDQYKSNTNISAHRIYTLFTHFNFAYRWAMERTTRNKPSNAELQTFATASIYNRQTALAERYLSVLDHTLYYKEWADAQRPLLDPDVIAADTLFKLHRQIVLAPEGGLDNTELVEMMLLRHYTNLFAVTPGRMVLCLAATMVQAKEDEFWKLALSQVKLNDGKPLAKHVQEAALLFALKRNNPTLMEQIELMVGKDGEVCQKFLRHKDLLTSLLTQPTQTDVNTLAATCPGTYWTYYFIDMRQQIIYD